MPDARLDKLVSAIRDHSGLSLRDIEQAGEHGADAGWGGFTYTSDGAEFTRANRSLVWDLLSEDADSCGFENVAAFLASFQRADMADTEDGFDCLLSWYALESAGRYVADTREEREEAERERIEIRGYTDGKAAGSWVTDGNTRIETYSVLLAGIEDGDPMVLDTLPAPSLGGEWADSPTWTQVLEDEDCEEDDEGRPDLLTVYEAAFSDGVTEEVTRACRYQLDEAHAGRRSE